MIQYLGAVHGQTLWKLQETWRMFHQQGNNNVPIIKKIIMYLLLLPACQWTTGHWLCICLTG
jgi:hypothetical protein